MSSVKSTKIPSIGSLFCMSHSLKRFSEIRLPRGIDTDSLEAESFLCLTGDDQFRADPVRAISPRQLSHEERLG